MTVIKKVLVIIVATLYKKKKKIIKLFLLLLRAELPSVVYRFTGTRLLAWQSGGQERDNR